MSSLTLVESPYGRQNTGPEYLVGDIGVERVFHTALRPSVKAEFAKGIEAVALDEAAKLGRRDSRRTQERFNTRMDRVIFGGLAVALGALAFHFLNAPSPGRVLDRAVQVEERFHTYTPSPADLKYQQLQNRINRGH